MIFTVEECGIHWRFLDLFQTTQERPDSHEAGPKHRRIIMNGPVPYHDIELYKFAVWFTAVLVGSLVLLITILI
jgi:hypothetical protein